MYRYGGCKQALVRHLRPLRDAADRIRGSREMAEDYLVLANQHRSEVANVVGQRGSDPLIERAHFLLVHVRPVALGDEARGMFRHGANMTRRTGRRKTGRPYEIG